MAPGKYDLHIYTGEDFSFEFYIEVGGELFDLTGCTVLSQIRPLQSRASLPVIADFTVDVTDSIITLSLTDAQTAAIDGWSEGFYDVLIIDTNNVDEYYLSGKVTFHNTVTVKP